MRISKTALNALIYQNLQLLPECRDHEQSTVAGFWHIWTAGSDTVDPLKYKTNIISIENNNIFLFFRQDRHKPILSSVPAVLNDMHKNDCPFRMPDLG